MVWKRTLQKSKSQLLVLGGRKLLFPELHRLSPTKAPAKSFIFPVSILLWLKWWNTKDWEIVLVQYGKGKWKTAQFQIEFSWSARRLYHLGKWKKLQGLKIKLNQTDRKFYILLVKVSIGQSVVTSAMKCRWFKNTHYWVNFQRLS